MLGGSVKFMLQGNSRARMGTQVHNNKSKGLHNTHCMLGSGLFRIIYLTMTGMGQTT